MYFILLVVLFAAIAAFAPKSWFLLKLFVLAPLVGVAFGGFTWAISAMFCGALITWHAFGTFLLGGTLLSEVAFLKAD